MFSHYVQWYVEYVTLQFFYSQIPIVANLLTNVSQQEIWQENITV